MTQHENWAEYVRRVTRSMTQVRIAKATGVAQTGIGRWMRGETPAPRAESVVQFARALDEQPLEALIAAGYLTLDEAKIDTTVRPSIASFSTDELFEELRKRTLEG